MTAVTLYRWTNSGYLLRFVGGVVCGDPGGLGRAHRWGAEDVVVAGAGNPGAKRS